MNTIYDYPIIGEIALGIKTIIDSVIYIFKKPILLAFPVIGGIMTIANSIGFGLVNTLLYFIIKMSVNANIMQLPMPIEDLTLTLPNVINIFKNFAPKSAIELLGFVAFALLFSLRIVISAIPVYFYYWMATATSDYIEQNIIQNKQLPYGKSISYADTKSRTLAKLAILLTILLTSYLISCTLYQPSIDEATLATHHRYFLIASYILYFFAGSLIAFKSLSFWNILKENTVLLLKKPFTIATISLIIFGIDYLITNQFNFPPQLIITVFILPIVQTILYFYINKKSVKN